MGSANPSPIRLAILLCDTPQPITNAKYDHGYGGVFTQLLTNAAAAQGESLSDVATLTYHDIVNGLDSYPSLDDVDALLLTGSKHTAYENHEWILKLTAYTKQAIEADKKAIGVCFGHQIIGRAMGADLGRMEGWEIAVTDVDLTPEGKKAFGLDKMRVQQFHRDVVKNSPPGGQIVAHSAECANHALYAPGKYITIQGHPEFTEDIVTEIIVNRHKQGILDDQVYAKSLKKAPLEHDGVLIAQAFIRFLRSG